MDLRALITGINGFAGSHLADLLVTQPNTQVFGTIFSRRDNAEHLAGRVTLFQGDLRQLSFVESLLKESDPDRIYHLAGHASASSSWKDPWETFEINLHTQANILRVASRVKPSSRILVVGSVDEYGRVDSSDIPIDEETPLRPDSPYAISKVAQDFLGLQYHLSDGLWVVRVRPCNHIGPRQSEQFVTASFAKQIAEIEAHLHEPVLFVGNLSAQRDFTDVRDMAEAYSLALERGSPGQVYNIGSGRAHSIRQLLDLLLKDSHAAVSVQQDPARLRPSDTPIILCDALKFRNHTGWNPRIPIEQSLRDTLDYWRRRVVTSGS